MADACHNPAPHGGTACLGIPPAKFGIDASPPARAILARGGAVMSVRPPIHPAPIIRTSTRSVGFAGTSRRTWKNRSPSRCLARGGVESGPLAGRVFKKVDGHLAAAVRRRLPAGAAQGRVEVAADRDRGGVRGGLGVEQPGLREGRRPARHDARHLPRRAACGARHIRFTLVGCPLRPTLLAATAALASVAGQAPRGQDDPLLEPASPTSSRPRRSR